VKARKDRGLAYNHYANVSIKPDIELEASLLLESEQRDHIIETSIINGYDGYGGVHDNLVWHTQAGWCAYTLHNKVIFENTKTREQTVLVESTVQLSTLAISPDKKLLAASEGTENKRGNALIYIFDTQTRMLV
jgi:DNA-binding beta-propeller fold protein YncE